jgi:diguanylate cyclase
VIRLQQLLLFAGGMIVGLAFLPVVSRIFEPNSVHLFFDGLGRVVVAPFQGLTRLFSKRGARRPHGGPVNRQDEERAQRIADAVQAIQSMLVVLTQAVQRIDDATSTSSQTLTEVRGVINGMGLPPDLAQTAAHLVGQIDRVIASNNTLRGELASSQEVLTSQEQVIESLRVEVRLDKMTQFANRSYFDAKLEEMVKLNRRYNDGFYLLLIDIDNFKNINDNYGHQAGDRIIKGVAFKLKNALRESDFVARFGGDEFALILIKASHSAAKSLAWKLCHEIRDSRFILDGNEISVTLSIGCAAAVATDSVESILERADNALYRVKEEGRNGVQFA